MTDLLSARRAALEAQWLLEARRLQLHAELAIRLQDPLGDADKALLQRAATRIDSWERGPCSQLYIWAWRRILRRPAERITRYIVEDRYGLGNALAQISPLLEGGRSTPDSGRIGSPPPSF
ncbi:hypothetical protein [Stenotrophomonas sp. YIM B06876]|uniref:hypothetical protein n=1 Tax=Stenotrophomonas sp. YIM B06876 TaxID=3060211 RepID=UPI002738C996|nr:hypothetical protein [Stenotrophomonas sp. YIM B06876]